MATKDTLGHTAWTFAYPQPELLVACHAKTEYHRGKTAEWQEKLKASQEDLQQHGMFFEGKPLHLAEGSAGGTNDPLSFSNQYQQPRVQIDAEKDRVFREALAKWDEHKKKLETFERFERAIQREDSKRVFPLIQEDLEFFGL